MRRRGVRSLESGVRAMPALLATLVLAGAITEAQETTAQEVREITDIQPLTPDADGFIRVGDFVGYVPNGRIITAFSNNLRSADGSTNCTGVDADSFNRELVCYNETSGDTEIYTNIFDRLNNFLPGLDVCDEKGTIYDCNDPDGAWGLGGRLGIALYDNNSDRFFVSGISSYREEAQLLKYTSNNQIIEFEIPTLPLNTSSFSSIEGLSMDKSNLFITWVDELDLNNEVTYLVKSTYINGEFGIPSYYRFASDTNDEHGGSTINPVDLDSDGTTDKYIIVINGQVYLFALPGQSSTTDTDSDGIADSVDNCPTVSNPDQANADGDSRGNACDPCPEDASNQCGTANDRDGDGVPDNQDNCPDVANATQVDSDEDGVGNACDACTGTGPDGDHDGICDSSDSCPADATNTCNNNACDSYPVGLVCNNTNVCPDVTTSTPCEVLECSVSLVDSSRVDYVTCQRICTNPEITVLNSPVRPGGACTIPCSAGGGISGIITRIDMTQCTLNEQTCKNVCPESAVTCESSDTCPEPMSDTGEDVSEDTGEEVGNNMPGQDTGVDGDIPDETDTGKPNMPPKKPEESCTIFGTGGKSLPRNLQAAILLMVAATTGFALGRRDRARGK